MTCNSNDSYHGWSWESWIHCELIETWAAVSSCTSWQDKAIRRAYIWLIYFTRRQTIRGNETFRITREMLKRGKSFDDEVISRVHCWCSHSPSESIRHLNAEGYSANNQREWKWKRGMNADLAWNIDYINKVAEASNELFDFGKKIWCQEKTKNDTRCFTSDRNIKLRESLWHQKM